MTPAEQRDECARRTELGPRMIRNYRSLLRSYRQEADDDDTNMIGAISIARHALDAFEAATARSPAHPGPWRIRRAEPSPWPIYLHKIHQGAPIWWLAPKDGGCEPLLFAKLGPATEPGAARHAQRLHGGVIVRVRGGSPNV